MRADTEPRCTAAAVVGVCLVAAVVAGAVLPPAQAPDSDPTTTEAPSDRGASPDRGPWFLIGAGLFAIALVAAGLVAKLTMAPRRDPNS